jgi:hypothetical protein
MWVDTLSLHWKEQHVLWAFPPPHLLPRVISHFRACGACGTLIILDQPGAPWWPALRSVHGWARFVGECRPLAPAQAVLRCLSHHYADVFDDRSVLALCIDGRSS